ncbi:hypothetical protein [Mesorhizobium opportunistum]|uniref:hypothetical protein n=1 Tax=Mesorhizobium opportunistum TaxID=593909 RepID=UPI0012370964|nr:hypothetical protein [Mesorhizobium opportunistum]
MHYFIADDLAEHHWGQTLSLTELDRDQVLAPRFEAIEGERLTMVACAENHFSVIGQLGDRVPYVPDCQRPAAARSRAARDDMLSIKVPASAITSPPRIS